MDSVDEKICFLCKRVCTCQWNQKERIKNKERTETRVCPLSLMLFKLVVESFPIVINQFKEKSWLQCVQVQGFPPKIMVLQYADDMVMFLHRSNDLARRIHRYLLIFSALIGFGVNIENSWLYDVGRDYEVSRELVMDIRVPSGDALSEVLGLTIKW